MLPVGESDPDFLFLVTVGGAMRSRTDGIPIDARYKPQER